MYRPGEDEEKDAPGFSGMRSAAPSVEAIDASVTRQVAKMMTGDGDVWNPVDMENEDEEEDAEATSDGFVALQPQFKQAAVVKKLRLLEKQVQHRDQQLQRLHDAHQEAEAAVGSLQGELHTAQQDLVSAQDDWEEEKEALLRFRGGNASAMLQLQVGLGGGAAGKGAGRGLDAQRQRERRQQMLNGAAEAQEMLDTDMEDVATRAAQRGLWLQWKKFRVFLRRRLYPFSTDIRQIEARFGSSVAAYFRFFAWIIMTFMVTAVPCVVLLVLHIVHLTEQTAVTDWQAMSGFAPTFLQFPGYVPDEALVYSIILLVMEALLLLLTLRKWIAEDQMAKMVQAIERASEQPKYSRILLNAWDFSLTTSEQVSDLKKTIAEQVKLVIEDEKRAETIKMRTKKEKYILLARRFVAFVLYLAIQAASWYLIILLTTQSSEIQLQIATNAAVFAPYVDSIVPAVVTVINAILPKLISLLTAMEKWDDAGFAIKAMVTRLYLAKILNVLIQMFSFALLLDPLLLTSTQSVLGVFTVDGSTVRKNVMLEFKSSTFTCRAEQASAGMLTLVVTDFTISKLMAVSAPLLRVITKKAGDFWRNQREKRALAKSAAALGSAKVVPALDDAPLTDNQESTPLRSSEQQEEPSVSKIAAAGASLEPEKEAIVDASQPADSSVSKSEFLVPQKMVALLYSCTIALVAIPLAPSTALLALMLHVANFKFDKFILLHVQKKPTNPWSAKAAGSFFVKFYFCTVLIFLTCAHCFLLDTRLPKQCALQDALLSSSDDQLCVTDTYDDAQQLCTLNMTHYSSEYFLTGPECSTGYPRCICEYACGPFTTVVTGYTPVHESVAASSVTSAVYSLVLGSKFVAWALLFVFLLTIFFLRNSLTVYVMITLEREQDVALTFTSLRKKIKQLENRLRLNKIGASDARAENAGNKSAPA